MDDLKPIKLEGPTGLQDGIKTVVRNFADIVKAKLAEVKDLATLQVMLPVHIRMQKRVESIRKMGAAQTIKVNNRHHTTPPQMHIRGLQGVKISNDEARVEFSVFEMDEKGRKIPTYSYSTGTDRDGNTFKREQSAEYRIAYDVVETIGRNKAITREVTKVLG